MAFCEQCGAVLDDDARFCQDCGRPVPEPVVRLCAGCGQPLPEYGAFCPSCGLSVNAAAEVEAEGTDDALVVTVTVAEDEPADVAEEPAEEQELAADQEITADFQMDIADLSSITSMLSDGVQADQQRLLDLVRQMAVEAE